MKKYLFVLLLLMVLLTLSIANTSKLEYAEDQLPGMTHVGMNDI
ncbi:hypothetical protein ACQKM9_01620 [Viridibacillus sp. NPDC093762]